MSDKGEENILSGVQNDDVLHFAVMNRNNHLLQMLLESGTQIDARDSFGRTPLHDAIDDKNMEATILLLKHGADVNAIDNDGKSLLHVAVEKGCLQTVENLLISGAIVNSVCSPGGYTPLHLAVKRSNVEVFRLLISKGANADARTNAGETALSAAARFGFSKIVKALLEYYANVKLNVESKVNAKNRRGFNALHIATRGGHKDVIKVLLKYGADINSSDENGRTALHIAALHTKLKAVITLLHYGADVNTTTNISGNTPLDYAMRHFSFVQNSESFKIVSLLVCHIIKMYTANFDVCHKNLEFVFEKFETDIFQDICEKEVSYMKKEKFFDTNISFYDILSKDTCLLAFYMRNDNVMMAVNSKTFKAKFPLYAKMLNLKFKKGLSRRILLEQSYTGLKYLFNNFGQLPDLCTAKISSFLNEQDLKSLANLISLHHE